MKKVKCKILYKGELKEANRQAIKAGCNAIDPEYLDRLPNMRYPITFTLPWELHGWVRCQVLTATGPKAEDFGSVQLDVPEVIFSILSEIEFPVDKEVGAAISKN